MRVVYKGKNTSLTPSLAAYLEGKLIKITEKLLGRGYDDDQVLLELEVARTTRHHRKGEVWRAEANLTLGKKLLRASQAGEGPHEAIDLLEDELSREIKSYKEKYKTKRIRAARAIKRLTRRNPYKKPLH